MTTPAWPLPNVNPLIEGYQETYATKTVSYQHNHGPTHQREVVTAEGAKLGCSFRVSNSDWATLKDFLDVDCKGGAQKFTYDHPIDGELTLQFIPPVTRKVTAGTRGSSWDVQMTIEILP